MPLQREKCAGKAGWENRRRGGERGTEYRQTLSFSHTSWCGEEIWRNGSKRWEKDVLQMCFSFDLYFFTSTCSVWRAETLQMCKFCRHWGSNWFLTVGFTSWLVDMQPVRSSAWECHSAVRVCSFVWCAYYDGTPEEAALSETSFKINICSPSCEKSFDSDHRIRKANRRLKQM